MSRLRLAIHGVTTSYLLLGATAVYALGSIPLALHYLTEERFGLWALLGSLIVYLNMIDLGMSSSVGRHLVDVKDDRQGGAYGSMIKTGWCVLWVQAVILIIIGFVCAGIFSRWMDIPVELAPTFRVMIWLQCGVVALGFVTKMSYYLLVAHQRMDLTNYAGILSLVVNFCGLWIFFALGADVYSLVYAGLVACVSAALFQFAWCWKLSLFPQGLGWGRVSGAMFWEIFNYGRDVFLVALGSQLIMASQTMIITRQLGLEAAAAWSVGTRTFFLVGQAIWRVSGSSLPALSEMLARGEMDRLRGRYPSLVILVTSLSVYCAITFALCNSAFVSVWTSGKVFWPPLNDVLLGLWMVVLTMLNANASFVVATKQIYSTKYVYFLEGMIFVLAAILTIQPFGLAGMILCSILCSVCLSGAYSAWRVSRSLGFSFLDVSVRWSRRALLLMLVFAPLALAVWWSTQSLNLQLQLLLRVLASAVIGLPLFLRLGIPKPLKQELVLRAPRRFGPFVAAALGRS